MDRVFTPRARIGKPVPRYLDWPTLALAHERPLDGGAVLASDIDVFTHEWNTVDSQRSHTCTLKQFRRRFQTLMMGGRLAA